MGVSIVKVIYRFSNTEYGVGTSMITPPKPNMVHLKITPLKRKLIFTHLPNLHFGVPCLFFGE